MNQTLREQVRSWRIDREAGLLSEAEFLSQVDAAIMTTADPPDYLVRLTLGESLAFEPRIDIVAEPPTQAEVRGLVLRVADKAERGALGDEALALVCLRLESGLAARFQDLCSTCSWISEEWHRIVDYDLDPAGFAVAAVRNLKRSVAKL